MCATEKLKLDRDFSKYNYLSLDSAAVNGLDDAANFRTVRVSSRHAFVCLKNNPKQFLGFDGTGLSFLKKKKMFIVF